MDSFFNISIFALVQIFMLVGLFGLVIPVFPGIVVMWLAALAYGLVEGWSRLGIVLFVVITLLMIAGTTVDNVLMGIGARKGGASWGAIAAGWVGGVLGTLLLPPVGGLIAAPLAVILVEYNRVQDWNQAWLAFRGLATGWGLSFVARFFIGLFIMGLWWVWVWRG